MELLTRDTFRKAVFTRDNFICVFCPSSAKDAHHILERRLFNDGGYYLNNGASVCSIHHIECEKTNITVEEVRTACGITKACLPDHFYSDVVYDKWGNIILENGQRIRGELFYDESVQLILKAGNKLDLFVKYVKYPRTWHLPWSENMHKDDRILDSLREFEGKRVIITEKMDGENTTLYNDHIHSRSLDGRSHPSQDWVKGFWNNIRYDIPESYRICGENLYAKHSIEYNNLPSYFMGFSVWNDKNICLSWDETLEWFKLINIIPVKVLLDDIFNIDKIKEISKNIDRENTEGYVLRTADEIHYKDFRKKVGKFVRQNHLKTIDHGWRFKQIQKNLMGRSQ